MTRHPKSIWMEDADWKVLERQARRLELPPHVYARSLLVRAVKAVERGEPDKASPDSEQVQRSKSATAIKKEGDARRD